MNRWIVLALCAFGLFVSSVGAAQSDLPKKVQKAIAEEYSEYDNVRSELTGTREIMGVKVYEIRVTTSDGDSTARVTENGDFLISGSPRAPGGIPARATRATAELFNKPPRDVEAFTMTWYYVHLDANGHFYQIKFDPTGRIRDISSRREMDASLDVKTEKASDDERNLITQNLKKRFEKAKVKSVARIEDTDFFVAELTTEGDHEGRVVLNQKNTLESARIGIDQKELPKSVLETLQRLFGNFRVIATLRGEYRYYEYSQDLGADSVRVRVLPSGDIISVMSERNGDEEPARRTNGRK